jgi:hypothetical protein
MQSQELLSIIIAVTSQSQSNNSMNNLQVELDRKSYPLMMHLSIVPKLSDAADEQATYNPATQTSNFSAMSGSWCPRSGSTDRGFITPKDDDQKEDD